MAKALTRLTGGGRIVDLLWHLPTGLIDRHPTPSIAAARPRATPAAPPVDDGAKEDPLLAALGFDPIGLDALVARTGQSAADLAARLLDLELAGRVARMPGQVFQRIERG